jgi:hypothetical protein
MDVPAPNGVAPEVWELLVMRVQDKKCTPIIGPQVVADELPQWSEVLAATLASRPEYPSSNDPNLMKVAQYLKYAGGLDAPGLWIAKYIRECEEQLEGSPLSYRALADLRLPLYITTNIDSQLSAALSQRVDAVQTAHYAWQRFETMERTPPVEELDPDITAVFHLWGQASEPSSLVLSEDDVIDFAGTAAVPGGNGNLPSQVREALSRSALLFVGYRPEDWTFRLLLRGLLRLAQIRRTNTLTSINLQFAPSEADTAQRSIDAYYNDYLGHLPVRVIWVEPVDLITSLAAAVAPR